MPVPTTRKRSRRAMINAGRPVADFIRFNTAGRRAMSPIFYWLMERMECGRHRRSTLPKQSYRHFIELLAPCRAEYAKYLAAGEPNIFA